MPRAVKLFTKRNSASNCGLEFVHFYEGQVGANAIKWSWEQIAKTLGISGNLQSLIAFSGNDQQVGPSGPHKFAKWLEKQGERIHSSQWTFNYNSGNKIRSYFWVPSLKARREVAAAQAKMKTASQLYHGDNW